MNNKIDLIKKFDKKNSFISMFSPCTGFYMRTGIIQNGIDTGKDPFMAECPELIDIGIMGHCIHGKSGLCIKSGVECYQNGLHIQEPNMTLENFKRVTDECKGKVYQFALGGRGDPDQHENFKDILKYSRDNNIVPNFTSSGFGFDEYIVNLCKEYCGAVAVSWYESEYTIKAVNMLLQAKVKTNIHFVLSNNSINNAIKYLNNNEFLKGINAVIFLLHKPIGLGSKENVLKVNDERLKEFFNLIDKKYSFKIGFDSCSVPALLNFNSNILTESIDTCEAGRWSMYISSDMKAMPCSFDCINQDYSYDISNDSIENAWNSDVFENFRHHFKNTCTNCEKHSLCLGGCPISRDIILCRNIYK